MQNRYLIGILIVIAGGACLSTSGILIRLMDDAQGWQIIMYRSATFFLSILAIVAVKYKRRTLDAYAAIGDKGIIAAFLLGLGSVCYIFAMLNTTVANVVFIIGSAPLVTALLAWVILGERVSNWSLAAMLAAVAGIGLMFLDGLVSGGLLGNSLALLMVVMFAFYLLILRDQRDIDMIPATGLSGLITFCIAAWMVQDPSISLHDLVICILLGSFQFGLGFMLITLATRYIDGALVALLGLSEVVLAPLWVWLGIGERPAALAMVGGVIVLGAVASQIVLARSEATRT